jgi:aminomethyltransferase
MLTTIQSADPPTTAHDTASDLDALLHHCAAASLSQIGWIRVTGSDRVRWLNGMVTNSIPTLVPGEGCYNFVLNAQGRIEGELTAWMLEDSILLETSRDQLPALIAHLDRFIIMDDVELANISDQRHGLLVAGPDALRTVSELGGAACPAPAPATQLATDIDLKQTAYRGTPVDLIRAHSPIVPRLEIWSDAATIAQISTELAPILQASPASLEYLRILEGTPRYGTDIRNDGKSHDLPQETGQTRALHFSKGCYLGQEIVERIHSRGSVHRTLSGFKLKGTLPEPGAALTAEGRPVGEFTSVGAIPLSTGTIQLALGYVRREALLAHAQARGFPLEYPGGIAIPVALPSAILPYTILPEAIP